MRKALEWYILLAFSRAWEIAEVKELRLKLSDQRWADVQRQNDAEQAGLHVDARVCQLVEGEAVKQAYEHIQGEFSDCVFGGAPVADECPLHHRARTWACQGMANSRPSAIWFSEV